MNVCDEKEATYPIKWFYYYSLLLSLLCINLKLTMIYGRQMILDRHGKRNSAIGTNQNGRQNQFEHF